MEACAYERKLQRRRSAEHNSNPYTTHHEASQLEAAKTALVLTGGGARAAYQVGVLRAVAELTPAGGANPFGIVCGSSAGAINAAALAVYCDNFQLAVRHLRAVWEHFHVDQVYRADAIGVGRNSAHWLLALLLGGLGRRNPVSLLDNRPLAELLQRSYELIAAGKGKPKAAATKAKVAKKAKRAK